MQVQAVSLHVRCGPGEGRKEGGRGGEGSDIYIQAGDQLCTAASCLPDIKRVSKDVRLHEDFQHPVVFVAGWSSAPIPDP